MLSSSASLSKMSKSGHQKSAQPSYKRYSSPLDYSRPGTSGYHKRSSSPARGRSAKRARGGRDRSPSASSHRGFRRYESCPCPLVIGGCLSLQWQVWSDKGADPWVVEVLRWGYRILSCGPHTIQGTHPFSFVRPLVHQGQSHGCRSALCSREGSSGACSTSVSMLLQPFICGNEGLRVLETGDRSFLTESKGSQDTFQDGDSPVSSSLSSEGRLDGVSGLERCVLASSDPPGQSQVPQVRGFRSGLPIQSLVLRSLHGTSGSWLRCLSCFIVRESASADIWMIG